MVDESEDRSLGGLEVKQTLTEYINSGQNMKILYEMVEFHKRGVGGAVNA